jgi:hypothetical protein
MSQLSLINNKIISLLILLICVTLLASCSGSTEPNLGKYYLIDETGNIDTESYIELIDNETLAFVNIVSDDYVNALYNDMISITVKNEATGEDEILYKEGASSDQIERIRNEFVNDITNKTAKYSYEKDGNVHSLFVELLYSLSILDYFPEKKEITFYNQTFKFQ